MICLSCLDSSSVVEGIHCVKGHFFCDACSLERISTQLDQHITTEGFLRCFDLTCQCTLQDSDVLGVCSRTSNFGLLGQYFAKIRDSIKKDSVGLGLSQKKRAAGIIVHIFHELLNPRCPNVNCHKVVDPQPDGCCAMTHDSCQTRFCWVCFQISPTNAECHEHVRTYHGGTVFVPVLKVGQSHRALLEQRVWAMTDNPDIQGDVLDQAILQLGKDIDAKLVEVAYHRQKPQEIQSLFPPLPMAQAQQWSAEHAFGFGSLGLITGFCGGVLATTPPPPPPPDDGKGLTECLDIRSFFRPNPKYSPKSGGKNTFLSWYVYSQAQALCRFYRKRNYKELLDQSLVGIADGGVAALCHFVGGSLMGPWGAMVTSAISCGVHEYWGGMTLSTISKATQKVIFPVQKK